MALVDYEVSKRKPLFASEQDTRGHGGCIGTTQWIRCEWTLAIVPAADALISVELPQCSPFPAREPQAQLRLALIKCHLKLGPGVDSMGLFWGVHTHFLLGVAGQSSTSFANNQYGLLMS